ncbi:UNVERIFIED_CONTAM: hypothetical protein HDU68_008617 [Siphonaria sp. JEL0065]|nr:hypothetical protein HDU68_008617 [Siphonaria sp. JEL0065]
MVAVDACAALIANPINGTVITTGVEVETCFNTFTVTQADKKDQIDAFKGYFNSYPYKDIVKNVGQQGPLYYPLSVNLYQELDAITTNDAIKTEYQFQNAIADLINRLEDGHISYRPLCFQSFRFYQPFSFTSKNAQVIVDSLYVAPTHPMNQVWAKSFNGANANDFIGAKVNSINGQDPVTYLQSFVDKFGGIGHAPETRYNTLYPTYNYPSINANYYFAYSRNRRAQPPTTYEFQFANKTTKTITLEWPGVLQTSIKNFADASTYYKKECTAAPPKAASLQTSEHEMNPHLVDPVSPFLDDFEAASEEPVNEFSGSTIVASDAQGAFLIHDDNITGIYMLSTFHPSGGFADYAPWLKNVTDGLNALEEKGAKRLIIDVSNNGGGYVCAGWYLANFLFPQAKLLPTEFVGRMTQQLADNIITLGDNNTFAGGENLKGEPITDYVNGIVLPGSKITGYPHLYSNRFRLIADSQCPPLPKAKSPSWKVQDVLIVSNGLCGSTCAQFTTLLRDQVGVRTVTYGGGKKRSTSGQSNFDPTAFAAGDVLPFTVFLSELGQPLPKTVNVTSQDPEDSLLPRPFKFPIGSTGQIPFLTSYSPKPSQPDLPTEWVINPSEFFVDNVQLGDPTSVWKAVLDAKFFEAPLVTKTTAVSSVVTATDAIATGTASASGRPPVVDGYVAPKNIYSAASSVTAGAAIAVLSLWALF